MASILTAWATAVGLSLALLATAWVALATLLWRLARWLLGMRPPTGEAPLVRVERLYLGGADDTMQLHEMGGGIMLEESRIDAFLVEGVVDGVHLTSCVLQSDVALCLAVRPDGRPLVFARVKNALVERSWTQLSGTGWLPLFVHPLVRLLLSYDLVVVDASTPPPPAPGPDPNPSPNFSEAACCVNAPNTLPCPPSPNSHIDQAASGVTPPIPHSSITTAAILDAGDKAVLLDLGAQLVLGPPGLAVLCVPTNGSVRLTTLSLPLPVWLARRIRLRKQA